MKAYSDDLRQRIVRAADQGMPRRELVATFRVSLATIKRYLQQRRDHGHLQPKQRPGRPAHKGAALVAALISQLRAYPDATLAEQCQHWAAATGVLVSTATMSRAIARVGWTRKKRRWVPARAMSSSASTSATGSPSSPSPGS